MWVFPPSISFSRQKISHLSSVFISPKLYYKLTIGGSYLYVPILTLPETVDMPILLLDNRPYIIIHLCLRHLA